MRHTILLFASALITIIGASGILEKSIFPPLPVAVLDANDTTCKKESEIYIKNLDNFTLWAYEMWDATAKSPAGVLRGSVFQMGHFEQCLMTEAPFLTKYCLIRFTANVPKPKQNRDSISLYHHPNEHIVDKIYPYKDVSQQARNVIQVGWCIPASCSTQDLETFLRSYVNELDLPLKQDNVTYDTRVSELTCHTKRDKESFTAADISFCSLILILVLLLVGATIYEYNTEEKNDEKPVKKSLLQRLFLTFSARKNFNDLTRIDESNGAMNILYGIRTICIFCIIVDHRFGTFVAAPLLNFDYVEKQYRSKLAPFLFHGDLFVDTFFVLGGLLVTYGLLNQFDKKKIQPGFIILMRYIRLTPIYAFVIFYYATLFNYTGSGPMWKVVAGQDSQDCRDNWWTNILYISNYVNADHMCMVHSWYLPCDFHYFIIAIGVCLLLQKKNKVGLYVLLLLTMISIVIPFALTIIYERPALLHFYPEFLTGPKIHPDFLLTYIKSHTRATPYFIGMFAGYIYYKLKGKESHMSRFRSYLLLLISALMILTCLVGSAVFYDPYHKYNSLESAVYAGLNRAAFALGSVGIIYVCSYGHAAVLAKILTWSPWIPLSKLVYGAYLTHMQFQLRAASKFLNPRQFSYFDLFSLSMSDIMMSFLTALGLYLLVEAPFRKLFREILMPNRVSPPQERTDSTTIRDNMTNGTSVSRL